ncbi:hypothetical protein VNO80_09097 [Phaseolus coccineus]|uniref:Uncharacterized protein n=1 Tax=Phaseolus coccineus TaxID=3886 RepID=A0AAN9NBW9_PHACN
MDRKISLMLEFVLSFNSAFEFLTTVVDDDDVMLVIPPWHAVISSEIWNFKDFNFFIFPPLSGPDMNTI